jgi:hypothetical protein
MCFVPGWRQWPTEAGEDTGISNTVHEQCY